MEEAIFKLKFKGNRREQANTVIGSYILDGQYEWSIYEI